MEDDNKELTGLAKVNADRKAAKDAKKAAEKEAAGTGENPNPPAPSADPDPKTSPAGDPPGGDPSPEFRGNAPGDVAGKTEPTETTEAGLLAADDPWVVLAQEYARLYPKNDIFYITSDRQVFLANAEQAAKFHQRGKQGEVVKITIKRD